jgi:hypothetical protein
MASTFKCLATATTHCDLSQIHQHRRGIIATMILHIDPVHHPYSDYRNVNTTIPIKLASDSNHLTSTDRISIAAIQTQVLVFSTLVPRNMQLGFSGNS